MSFQYNCWGRCNRCHRSSTGGPRHHHPGAVISWTPTGGHFTDRHRGLDIVSANTEIIIRVIHRADLWPQRSFHGCKQGSSENHHQCDVWCFWRGCGQSPGWTGAEELHGRMFGGWWYRFIFSEDWCQHVTGHVVGGKTVVFTVEFPGEVDGRKWIFSS